MVLACLLQFTIIHIIYFQKLRWVLFWLLLAKNSHFEKLSSNNHSRLDVSWITKNCPLPLSFIDSKIVQMAKPWGSDTSSEAIFRCRINICWFCKLSDPDDESAIINTHQGWPIRVNRGFHEHLKIVQMTKLTTPGCGARVCTRCLLGASGHH